MTNDKANAAEEDSNQTRLDEVPDGRRERAGEQMMVQYRGTPCTEEEINFNVLLHFFSCL